jgi:hypothetical protein
MTEVTQELERPLASPQSNLLAVATLRATSIGITA